MRQFLVGICLATISLFAEAQVISAAAPVTAPVSVALANYDAAF
jgi:hypothetical protein